MCFGVTDIREHPLPSLAVRYVQSAPQDPVLWAGWGEVTCSLEVIMPGVVPGSARTSSRSVPSAQQGLGGHLRPHTFSLGGMAAGT